MISVLTPSPLRVAALLLAAIWFCAAPAEAGENFATRFEVFGFAGIKVLTLRTVTKESGDRYAITADFATEGLASLFADLTSHTEVGGRLVGDSAQPESFRGEWRRNGEDRSSRIDYGPDGNIDTATAPPLPGPVAQSTLRGTVDNLTAYFRLERQLAHTGSCALTARVFDGRHAYDLVFSDAGRGALAPAGGQNFAGSTIACAMVRYNWPYFPDPTKDEGARQGTIWYARLGPVDLMVPVRTRMDTQLGTVDGFLADLHGSGVDLALMK